MTLTPIREQLASLPLWAQVLAASRIVRRAAMAVLPHGPESDIIYRGLDALDSCTECGWSDSGDKSALDAAANLRDRGRRETATIREAMFWAVDACRAAIDAESFPSDAAVTNSAANAILSLSEGRQFSSTQVQAVAAADLDLLRFACREVPMMKYAPVSSHVLSRLTPVHPLSGR